MNNPCFDCDFPDGKNPSLNQSIKYHDNKITIVYDDNYSNKSLNESHNLSSSTKKILYANDEWYSMTAREKCYYLFSTLVKMVTFVVLLYVFLISLNFMSIGFTMIAGYSFRISKIISYVLSSPIGALCIGIIFTAIIQNAT